MAKLALKPDERVISTHPVTLVERGSQLPATIHLTTQRLVVTPGAGLGSSFRFAFNPLVLLFGSMRRNKQPRIYHQMRRDRFASIEAEEGNLIVFHDDGEGYAHVSFAITPDVFAHTPDSFEMWQERMSEWAPTIRETEDSAPST
jgi:hypothetical protein